MAADGTKMPQHHVGRKAWQKSLKLVLIPLVLIVTAFAQTTDLNGKWTVAWSGSTKTNAITLTETEVGRTMTILNGTFVADDSEECAVRGSKSNGLDRQLDMDINCATWRIRMTGTVDVDGKRITGGFTTHYPDGHGIGDYLMARDK